MTTCLERLESEHRSLWDGLQVWRIPLVIGAKAYRQLRTAKPALALPTSGPTSRVGFASHFPLFPGQCQYYPQALEVSFASHFATSITLQAGAYQQACRGKASVAVVVV